MSASRQIWLPQDPGSFDAPQISSEWIERGLIAAWELGSSDAKDPLTGVSVPFAGSQSTITGYSGKARYFPGSGSVLDTDNLAGQTFMCEAGNQFSVFIKYQHTSANSGTLFARAGSASSGRILQIASSISGTGPSVAIRGTVTNLSWGFSSSQQEHSLGFTWDGTTARLMGDWHRNATLGVGAAANTSEVICVGSRTNASGFPYTGMIGCVYVFNRAIDRSLFNILHANHREIYSPISRWVPMLAAGGPPTLASILGVSTGPGEATITVS